MDIRTATTNALTQRLNLARNYAALIASLDAPTPLQQRALAAYQDIAADIDAELLRRTTAEFAAQGKVSPSTDS
jgi:hypothetical protein